MRFIEWLGLKAPHFHGPGRNCGSAWNTPRDDFRGGLDGRQANMGEQHGQPDGGAERPGFRIREIRAAAVRRFLKCVFMILNISLWFVIKALQAGKTAVAQFVEREAPSARSGLISSSLGGATQWVAPLPEPRRETDSTIVITSYTGKTGERGQNMFGMFFSGSSYWTKPGPFTASQDA